MTSRTARIRRRIGVSMMVSSLAVAGSMITLAPAGAQDASEPETVELAIVKTAYYTTSAGRGAPNTATNEFPPGVACIVAPELCPEEAQPVTGPVGEQLGGVEDLPTGPTQAVAPGTLPVGVQAGETRYRSALLLEVPAPPPGQEIGQFVLRLPEDPAQTYHTSSPMFRQAVLAALASYQSGGFNQEEFEKTLAASPVDTAVTGVEACPVTTEFTEGENQTEDAAPEFDCLFGANGVRLDDGTWEFDLTFAAAAWAEGSMVNNGIILRPAAAPNVAYGDKDPTSSARVVFAPGDSAEGAVANEPEPAPPAPFTPAPAPASPTFSSPVSSGGIAAPTIVPDVAPQTAEPQAAPAEPATEQVAVPFLPQDPSTPWWIWLLVPIFLAGMYLTAQSLTTEVVLAGERQGAMSRLIARNGGVAAAAGPAAPRQGAMSRLVDRS